MTRKDKSILLKDLCARLPYEVQCEIGGLRYGPYTFTGNDIEDLIAGRIFKPYLRPMSSMTEEEKRDLGGDIHTYYTIREIDWLNAHHFDYRGLIKRGLALEAPEGMYKTE